MIDEVAGVLPDTPTEPNLTQIPKELQQLRQWAPFKISSNGKKVPVPGFTVSNPSNWLTFEQVIEQYQTHKYLPAFVLTESDPYTVLDLDAPKKTHEDAESVVSDHHRIVELLADTYTERSQSGQGYHIWVKGVLPKAVKNAKACVELYCKERFIICTGLSNSQPILDDQEAVDGLYEKFKTRQGKVGSFTNLDQDYTDSDVLEKCEQRFPQRFKDLYYTATDILSDTKSEDDHALIAMLTEFSDNLGQIHRLFLDSKRARRKHFIHPENYITRTAAKTQKHRYTQINTDALLSKVKAPKQVAQIPTTPVPPTEPPQQDIFNKGYPQPMGLLAEIVKFGLDSAPYPDPDIALAGAIAYMAGVIGRRYTFNGSALNVYMALLAPSSHGKSAAGNICDNIAANMLNAVSADGTYQEHIPDAGNFFQSQIRSAPALYKNVLPKQQSFTWLVDELGKVEQVRGSQGNTNGTELQAALLELYSAQTAGGHLVSDKNSEPVPRVMYPAMSILGNSVENVFFDSLTEDSFTGGMFGRYFFVIVRRSKSYEQFGRNHTIEPALRKKLLMLTQQGLEAVGEGKAMTQQGICPITITDEATSRLREFSNQCVDNYNRWCNDPGADGATGALWGRLSHKVTKLAGLHAVSRYAGDDRLLLETTIPIVDVIDVRWGIAFVEHELAVLRTVSGEGHLEGDDAKRRASLLKALRVDFYSTVPAKWSRHVRERSAASYTEYHAITKSALYFLIKSKAGWSSASVARSRFRSNRELLNAVLAELVDAGQLVVKKVGNGEYYWLPEFYPRDGV